MCPVSTGHATSQFLYLKTKLKLSEFQKLVEGLDWIRKVKLFFKTGKYCKRIIILIFSSSFPYLLSAKHMGRVLHMLR